MLRISTRSMAALGEYAEERFIDRLVALVSASAPAEESPAAVRERCRDLVRRARSRGFSTEFEVAIYVACGFAEGMDFDQRADLPYRRIVESAEVSPRSKAQMLALALENSEEDAGEGEA